MELILNDIRQLILEARQQVLRSVNSTMVSTYWHIGKRIIEDEQDGQKRAKYATEMLKHLSQELSKEFGEGFSQTNLRQMRHFFLIYPIQQMPSAELGQLPQFPHPRISWSHYLFLMRLKYADELRTKIGIFRQSMSTKKALFLTFITTFGLTSNNYAQTLVQNPLTMDIFFD